MNTASRFTLKHTAHLYFLLNHSLFYLNKAYCDFGFVLFNRAALSWNISIKLQEVHPSFILTLSLSRLIIFSDEISCYHDKLRASHTHTHTHTHTPYLIPAELHHGLLTITMTFDLWGDLSPPLVLLCVWCLACNCKLPPARPASACFAPVQRCNKSFVTMFSHILPQTHTHTHTGDLTAHTCSYRWNSRWPYLQEFPLLILYIFYSVKTIINV